MSHHTCFRAECTRLVVRDIYLGGVYVASTCAEHSEIRAVPRERTSVVQKEPVETMLAVGRRAS